MKGKLPENNSLEIKPICWGKIIELKNQSRASNDYKYDVVNNFFITVEKKKNNRHHILRKRKILT